MKKRKRRALKIKHKTISQMIKNGSYASVMIVINCMNTNAPHGVRALALSLTGLSYEEGGIWMRVTKYEAISP